MSLFAPVHHSFLVDQFWTAGQACCPHDGAALSSQFHAHATGYLLALACLRCGRKVQVTRYSDPRRFDFRPWTGEEIAMLVEHAETGGETACPVCSSKVHVRNISGNSFRSLECFRCGNMHFFPHATVVEMAGEAVAPVLAS